MLTIIDSIRHFILLLMFIGLACPLNLQVNASEAPPLPTSSSNNQSDQSPLARETRQYILQLTAERNQLREANASYAGSQGFLSLYAVAITLLAGWLIYVQLNQAPLTAKQSKTEKFTSRQNNDATDRLFQTSTTTKKNATITVRNSLNQKTEVANLVLTDTEIHRAEAEPSLKSTRVYNHHQARPSTAGSASDLLPKDTATSVMRRQ